MGRSVVVTEPMDELRHIGGNALFVHVAGEDTVSEGRVASDGLRDEAGAPQDAPQGWQKRDVDGLLRVPQPNQRIRRKG